MVIFVHFIQLYSVCSRESIILQFTPSFLFSFLILLFGQGYWNYVFTSFAVLLPITLRHEKFCNLIGLEQWSFHAAFFFLKYLHVKITNLFRVVLSRINSMILYMIFGINTTRDISKNCLLWPFRIISRGIHANYK